MSSKPSTEDRRARPVDSDLPSTGVSHLRRGRRYQVVGPQRGELVTEPATAPGVGQVLVEVHANGVCASELPVWATEQPSYPIDLGHEPVGTIAATGPGVDLQVGTWVTGRFGPSFADYTLADLTDVVQVPDGVEPDQAIGEPLGCVAEAHRRTPIELADRVAVIGLGFMGLCLLQLLARSPLSRLAAIDLRPDARDTALQLGADRAHHPDELPCGSRWESSTRGSGFDVVVEATGSQPGLDLATDLVRPRGAISILGYHQSRRSVDMEAWNWKALDVVNAHVRDRDRLRDSTDAGLAMLAARRIDLSLLLTHRFPLVAVDDAFAALRTKPSGFIKAIVVND